MNNFEGKQPLLTVDAIEGKIKFRKNPNQVTTQQLEFIETSGCKIYTVMDQFEIRNESFFKPVPTLIKAEKMFVVNFI